MIKVLLSDCISIDNINVIIKDVTYRTRVNHYLQTYAIINTFTGRQSKPPKGAYCLVDKPTAIKIANNLKEDMKLIEAQLNALTDKINALTEDTNSHE